jgi:hypothetical protein
MIKRGGVAKPEHQPVIVACANAELSASASTNSRNDDGLRQDRIEGSVFFAKMSRTSPAY